MDPLVKGMDPLVKGRDLLVMGKDPIVRGRDPTNWGIDPLVKGKDPKVREPQDLGEVPGEDAHRAFNSGKRPRSQRQVGSVSLLETSGPILGGG